MQLAHFTVPRSATLRDALRQIESNHFGIVFATAEDGRIEGAATDGDIRRELLNGRSLDDPISLCVNTQFVYERPDTPRETLLKRLDHRIRVIPILDVSNRLVGVVSRDHLPILEEEAVYARSRAPVRISFGGGGSDLTHFFSDQTGAVINSTISLYSHATLRPRTDGAIGIHSLDLKKSLQACDLSKALEEESEFGLIKSLLKTIRPDFGFDLYLHSDFPVRSGLGGSAVVSAAVLGCFNQFRRDRWDLHELAELAFQAERLHLGIAGGWQDQYATVFGGFNFIEFQMKQNVVHPLRIPPDVLCELEESLILCDTGISHDSGNIHDDQRQTMQRDDVLAQVRANVELSYEIRNQLLRGRLFEFGQSLHKAWSLKRQFSAKISSSTLDQIYDEARKHGALGGKLLGAGGGGFFLFYVPPFRKHELMQHLQRTSLKIHPFRFEAEGLRSWSVRERRNHVEIES
jgi:D-glycero-alpha-D-manno-heptose-7-phosphate kinase